MSRVQFEHSVTLPGPFTVMQGMDGDGMDNTVDSSPDFQSENPEITAVQAWETERMARQTQEATDWLQMARYQQATSGQKTPVPILTSVQDRWWLHGSRLRVFTSLPEGAPAVSQLTENPSTLAPGSKIQGLSIHTFEKSGDGWISRGHFEDTGALPSVHHPKAGRIQYLELESPTGSEYVLLTVDGYGVLAPGTQDQPLFTAANGWWWKVTCAAGAVVRQNADLKSPVLTTVPYGAHVQVLKKVISRDGLSRLLVRLPGFLEGWCSQLLNPLSGQRGSVLQPIPPAVPVLYQVVLSPAGALIRQRVEMSSPVVGELPVNALVSVAGRVFTEFPTTDCVARIRLANQAFGSLRLNSGNKSEIFRPTSDIDPAFDPARPELFHKEAHARWGKKETSSSAESPASSPTSISSTHSSPRPSAAPKETPICVVCLTNEADATLIHGETGHICCCLECARLCKAKGMGCPLCRKRIERVILHFYS